MPGYTITVYDEKRNPGNTHILRVEGSGNKRIDLFYLKELQHFVCIKSRTEFFGQSVECPNCQFLHKNQNTHFCKTKCTQCRGRYVCMSKPIRYAENYLESLNECQNRECLMCEKVKRIDGCVEKRSSYVVCDRMVVQDFPLNPFGLILCDVCDREVDEVYKAFKSQLITNMRLPDVFKSVVEYLIIAMQHCRSDNNKHSKCRQLI